MRAKSIVLLLMALGCGLVASIGITQVMARRDAEPAGPSDETETVFVAMKDIPMGDAITAQMVKREPWPKGKVPTGALMAWEDVENRRPKVRIMAGWPILDNQLLGKGITEAGASGTVPKGYRVVPVKVDASTGGGGIIRPGDRVDVIAYIKPDPAKTITKAVTTTVLQDIKVFAVNDVWDIGTASEEKSMMAKTISLLATPEQAQILTMATELGTIRLVMRSPEDSEQKSLRGTDARELVGGGATAESTREPTLPQRVEQPDKSSADILGFLKDLSAKGKREPVQEVAAAAKPAAPPAEKPIPPAEKREYFTVRILMGSQVTDTVLESPGRAASDGSGQPPSFWKTNSGPPRSGPANRTAAPAALKPPVFVPAEPSAGDPDEKAGPKDQDHDKGKLKGVQSGAPLKSAQD